MKKLKRLGLFFRSKTLRLWKFLSNERYRNVSYKYFRDLGVVFEGKPKYINYDVDFDITEPNKIFVGENTVIAKGTILLTHDFSIECGLLSIKANNPTHEVQFVKEIHIGKECFIGARSFILPGTTIGNNCIIGAGSVVSGNIPSNSIYAGNPAKFIAHTDEWAKKKIEQNPWLIDKNENV